MEKPPKGACCLTVKFWWVSGESLYSGSLSHRSWTKSRPDWSFRQLLGLLNQWRLAMWEEAAGVISACHHLLHCLLGPQRASAANLESYQGKVMCFLLSLPPFFHPKWAAEAGASSAMPWILPGGRTGKVHLSWPTAGNLEPFSLIHSSAEFIRS